MQKLNKVVVEVKVEKKVDNRTNNTGRPVNKKSARQARLNNQAYLSKLNEMFVSGNAFKVNRNTYKYNVGENNALGSIVSNVTGYVCNVDYIGRTKVKGFTYVLGKEVKIELNLKTLEFVKE
tara:strand:+ start:2264 stop:2629 length:366 start_codon:yes stop_codon:yes gene_type:complete